MDNRLPFRLPFKDMFICIWVENKQRLGNKYSHAIYGQVEKVIEIQSTYCMVQALYIDKKDYKGYYVRRSDELLYAEYGDSRNKNWFAKLIDECTQSEKQVIQQINSNQLQVISVNDSDVPMKFVQSHQKKEIATNWEDTMCEVCESPDETDEKGKIIFCDECNRCYHTNCINMRYLPRSKEMWICRSCLDG